MIYPPMPMPAILFTSLAAEEGTRSLPPSWATILKFFTAQPVADRAGDSQPRALPVYCAAYAGYGQMSCSPLQAAFMWLYRHTFSAEFRAEQRLENF